MYSINSIFRDFIGEGIYTGSPAIFIRFQGCNLSCDFCDEPDARARKCHVGFTGLDAIIHKVTGFWDNWREFNYIVLTGGEPFMQLDEPLLRAMAKIAKVVIETNGTLMPDWFVGDTHFEDATHLTMSPKAGHIAYLAMADEVKILYPIFGSDSRADVLRSQGFVWKCLEDVDTSKQIVRLMPLDNLPRYARMCYSFAKALPGVGIGLQGHKLWSGD